MRSKVLRRETRRRCKKYFHMIMTVLESVRHAGRDRELVELAAD